MNVQFLPQGGKFLIKKVVPLIVFD